MGAAAEAVAFSVTVAGFGVWIADMSGSVHIRCQEESARMKKKPRHDPKKVWVYGIQTLADLFGVTNSTMRAAIQRKFFDPGDLNSICRYWLQRRVPQLVGDVPVRTTLAEVVDGRTKGNH